MYLEHLSCLAIHYSLRITF